MSSHLNEGQDTTRDSFSYELPNRPRAWSGQQQHSRGLKDGLERTDLGQRDVLIDSDLTELGGSELLAVDPRPTFVCKVSTITNDVLEIVFANPALRSDNKLWTSIQKASGPKQVIYSTAPEISLYRKWLENNAKQDVSRPESMPFSECEWNAFVVDNMWLIVGGSRHIFPESRPQSVSSTPSGTSISSQGGSDGNSLLKQQSGRANSFDTSPNEVIQAPYYNTPGTPDWTLRHPKGDLAPHVIFTRSIDWARTPLGDMNTWSREFRQIANLMMANPHPVAVFWGEELTVMYNKAYAETVAGDKHPKLMGMGFTTAGAFQELWDFVGPIFKKCRSTGESVAVSEQNLPIEHNGFLEETFFTWSLTPLYGGTSKILGLYNAPFETTAKSRAVRATQTLLKLGQELNKAQKVSQFWLRILTGIEGNGYDFPFAIIYSVADEFDGGDEDSSSASVTSMDMKVCVLEGALGVPEGHAAAPVRLDLKRARGGFIPSFRDAMRTREPKLLNILDGTLSESLLEGIEWRGYGEPCRSALVCPIRPTNGENVMGFLVIGVNPRRKYDHDYSALVRLLDRQLATSLASVTLFEAEIQRGVEAAHAAAAERTRLSRELEVQRTRLQRMAEISAVGMFSMDPEGHILEANDRWYEMTGHPRAHEENHNVSFMEGIHQGSIEVMKSGWARLTVDKLPWSGELQMNKRWNDPNTGDEVDYWILLAAQPEFSMDGRFLSLMGSITDITLQKQSEKVADMRARFTEKLLAQEQETKDLQKSQLEEAEENRRRQNNFIDITSHEMRNPLSAILQCADSIATSLKDTLRDTTHVDPIISSTIEAAIESAETIQLCAQHQKSIVDDILTISKLDSHLLLITPMPVQPVQVIYQTLKMFNTEVQLSDIEMQFIVDDSYIAMDAGIVMLDSSRLRQVIVNLVTNAIKFTKSETRQRSITLCISAHAEPPAIGPKGFRYFPTEKNYTDVTISEEWGQGSVIYLRVEVADSGCGLTEEEKKNLFTRYSQASPKTHVKYGGSGLGLFISRQLTELQGGEIGVASEAGVGSTFAFYIKVRRAVGQDAHVAHETLHPGLQVLNAPHKPSASRVSSAPASLTTIASLEENSPSHWHVLIVEDNLVNQKVLAKGIKKLGCTVHVANHGGEALELLQDTKHYVGQEKSGKDLTVILMDLEMPVMDGLTCVRKIRQLEKEGLLMTHLPVIAVTANARGEQVLAAKESGMDDVMPKPFQIRDLVPKIEALLIPRRSQRT